LRRKDKITDRKIGVIGYGSMGKMILEKFINSRIIEAENIFIANRTYDKIINLNRNFPQINISKENDYVAENVDILFICVKPLEIKTVLMEIISGVKDNCHIISLNGSILFKQLEQICVNKKISKVIPSVTAEINKSVTLICHNDNVKDDDKTILKILLECFGITIEIPEMEIGMISELTSCMPGFIGAMFKVITDEAEKHTKINKKDIIKMVIETMYGTGKLLLEKDMTFDDLIKRVATKKGITEEGTKVIENKFPETIEEMFVKTLEKRKTIAESAQNDFCK
jgi:pyrroline-5-carboxylate reductase